MRRIGLHGTYVCNLHRKLIQSWTLIDGLPLIIGPDSCAHTRIYTKALPDGFSWFKPARRHESTAAKLHGQVNLSKTTSIETTIQHIAGTLLNTDRLMIQNLRSQYGPAMSARPTDWKKDNSNAVKAPTRWRSPISHHRFAAGTWEKAVGQEHSTERCKPAVVVNASTPVATSVVAWPNRISINVSTKKSDRDNINSKRYMITVLIVFYKNNSADESSPTCQTQELWGQKKNTNQNIEERLPCDSAMLSWRTT
jgi:hypothetical protein